VNDEAASPDIENLIHTKAKEIDKEKIKDSRIGIENWKRIDYESFN
jgi:hypothetical protein